MDGFGAEVRGQAERHWKSGGKSCMEIARYSVLGVGLVINNQSQ